MQSGIRLLTAPGASCYVRVVVAHHCVWKKKEYKATTILYSLTLNTLFSDYIRTVQKRKKKAGDLEVMGKISANYTVHCSQNVQRWTTSLLLPACTTYDYFSSLCTNCYM